MGQWGACRARATRASSRRRQRAAPRVVWKTTTRMRKGGHQVAADRRVGAPRLPEIYDAAFHTRGADPADYWDPRHFRPRMYNELNAALLRQLYGRRAAASTLCTARATPRRRRRRPPAATRRRPTTRGPASRLRPPARWNALQTSLWVDALGITYNAAQLAQAETNGSALVRMAEQPGGLAQIGVKRPADVARLRARLRSAGAALSAQ